MGVGGFDSWSPNVSSEWLVVPRGDEIVTAVAMRVLRASGADDDGDLRDAYLTCLQGYAHE